MNQRLQKEIAIFLLLLVFLLSACGQKNEQDFLPKVELDSHQIFLFNPFSYELGIYDLSTMEWSAIDAQGAFFQAFDWGNNYSYYVVGAQDTHDFHLGKAEKGSLTFYYSQNNKKQALTPFATDGKHFLYLIEQVDEKRCLKRIVMISEEGKITPVANLDGMGVMGGVLIDGILYFTCPRQDSDFYEVWRLELSEDTGQQKPVLIRDDYNTFRLYRYRNHLLYIDIENRLLYGEDIKIRMSHSADLVWIDDEVNLLVEEYVNGNHNLEITFTDISSGKILGAYEKAINFTREDSRITIYGSGFIEYLDLPKGATYGVH